MFDVGEEGCVSTAEYMELGLYVRMRIYRIENRLRSDNHTSKERYKSNPVGSALILTPNNRLTLIMYRLSPCSKPHFKSNSSIPPSLESASLKAVILVERQRPSLAAVDT